MGQIGGGTGSQSGRKEITMYEYAKVLNKIEKLVEQLPYKAVKIEVELADQVLILEKQKTRQIGFIQE